MNTQSFMARMLTRVHNGLDSWMSVWRFLVHLNDLDFYRGLDGQTRR